MVKSVTRKAPFDVLPTIDLSIAKVNQEIFRRDKRRTDGRNFHTGAQVSHFSVWRTRGKKKS
jgi:hypothetical protein